MKIEGLASAEEVKTQNKRLVQCAMNIAGEIHVMIEIFNTGGDKQTCTRLRRLRTAIRDIVQQAVTE